MPKSPDPHIKGRGSVFADWGNWGASRVTAMGYLNLNSAKWEVPSINCTSSCRQVPAHAFSVFQT